MAGEVMGKLALIREAGARGGLRDQESGHCTLTDPIPTNWIPHRVRTISHIFQKNL
jgi:hypothetical protein